MQPGSLGAPEGSSPWLGRLALAGRRLAAHPTWSVEYARSWAYRRVTRDRALTPAQIAPLLQDSDAALLQALSLPSDRIAELRSSLESPTSDELERGAFNDGSIELQGVVNACVRALRPDRMVETGVARGFSAAVALRAMEDAGRGHLHSIEFPSLDPRDNPDADIGKAVPPALRSRWSLHLGPSRRLLPRLLDELGSIDVFLHDSDHAYPTQRFELETAWPHLRPGGVLICDDVQNPAFVEFAREVGVRPSLIERWPPGMAPLGIARK